MSHFTEKELAYLNSQPIARLATVNPKGQPQIAPVGYQYNSELDVIDIPGRAMSQTKKYRNAQTNAWVSLVIDDIVPPWSPRGIEIRGIAEAIAVGGKQLFARKGGGPDYWDEAFIRITPRQIIGWGLDDTGYKPLNRKVE